MREGRKAESAHLDALMYRMLGGLLLLGAAVLLGLVLLLLGLPRVDGGEALLLPGMEGRHTLSTIALPVLLCGVLLLGLPGLVAMALAHRRAPFRLSGAAHPRSFRRPAFVLLAGATVLAAVLLRR